MDAIKSHNPFAVNDIVFAKMTGADLDAMNNFGCPLIWGHPQGPTALRAIIELIEELAVRGGGCGLFEGCAGGGYGDGGGAASRRRVRRRCLRCPSPMQGS